MTMEGARSGKYSESRKERVCWTKRVACRLVLWPILEAAKFRPTYIV